MKTLYFRRANHTRTVVGVGAIVVVVLVLFGIRTFAPGFFFAASAPLLKSGTSVTASVGNTVNGFADASHLATENEALAEQLLTLKNQNQVLTARSQDLTKLLGGTEENIQGITAGVLARPPESPYDTLVVGAGTADGVKVGAEVFAQGGVPVGTIAAASAHSSQVRLFSSSGTKTSGWVGESRLPVSLVGAGAGAYTASLPKGAGVAVGDLAYLPGPGAIPMGTVVRLDTDPSSPLEILRIQPNVNLFSVTWVQISKTTP